MALTNNDYWQALASRLGRQASGFPSALGSSVNRAFDRASTRAGQFGRAIGSAAQTFNRFPVDLGRSALGAAGAFGNALATGEDPYEPAGPPTELIQAPPPAAPPAQAVAPFRNTPAPVASPPPESPVVVQTGGTIRYKLPGGEWSEYKGGSTAPTIETGTIHDPEDPMRPHSYTPTSGGGTVSMMTAPENEGIVNEASRMDDLRRRAAEVQMGMMAQDPMWEQRAKSQADIAKAIAIERGKVGAQSEAQDARLKSFMQAAAPLAEETSQLQGELERLRMTPEYQSAPPDRKAQVDAQYQGRIEAAQTRMRLLLQGMGMASGNVPSALFAQPGGFGS
jgi:hypothetical protein